MTGPLFSKRMRMADEALAKHRQRDDWSDRDRELFRIGAMMGVSAGYDLAANVDPTTAHGENHVSDHHA